MGVKLALQNLLSGTSKDAIFPYFLYKSVPFLAFDFFFHHQCRDPLGNIRSLVSEKMLEKLPAVCKFADNGCQVGRDLDLVEHVFVFVLVVVVVTGGGGGGVIPVVQVTKKLLMLYVLSTLKEMSNIKVHLSGAGGDAPVATWRSREKLRFPPRQLRRPCLSTEDTCVQVDGILQISLSSLLFSISI